jgi:hypothetical protein
MTDDTHQLPPRGFMPTTWQWAHAYFRDPAEIAKHYIRIGVEAQQCRYAPKGLDASISERFVQHMLQNPLAEHFVAVVPQGRIWGRNGAVISPDRYLLWDVSIEYSKPPFRHTALSQRTMPPLMRIPGTWAVLTCAASENYYHWMFEVLARFELLRQSGIEPDGYVLSMNGGLPFQHETLQLLGIPPDKLIDCRDFTHIQADRLVVPSMGGHTGHAPQFACEYLRANLLAHCPAEPLEGYECIYISRSGAERRRVLNEADVVRYLEHFGFRSVRPELLTVREQMRLFSSAGFIVAPHGAALTNLIFCRPGTKVVELFPSSYVYPSYWVPSHHVGLDYYYLIGPSYKGPGVWWEGAEDFVVPLGDLAQLLELAGLTGASGAPLAEAISRPAAPSLRIAVVLQQLMQLEGEQFIAECYRHLLGREPDPAGFYSHLRALRSGMRKAAIVAAIMRSGEAVRLYQGR